MKNNSSTIVWIIVCIVFIVAAFVLVGRSSKKSPVLTLADPSGLSGIQSSASTPWRLSTDTLKDRLSAIGLPALATEGTVMHIHEHLDIYIDGKLVPLPAGIGVDEKDGFISPVHVHEADNIIHVESPVVQDFTLGQFFDIWGVMFKTGQIGGYVTTNNKYLKVYVNGTEFTGDPRKLVLDAHQEIVVTYGTQSETPNPIPQAFIFPQGY